MEDKSELVYDFFEVILNYMDKIEIEISLAKDIAKIQPRILIVSNIGARFIKYYLTFIAHEHFTNSFHNIPIISSEFVEDLEFKLF